MASNPLISSPNNQTERKKSINPTAGEKQPPGDGHPSGGALVWERNSKSLPLEIEEVELEEKRAQEAERSLSCHSACQEKVSVAGGADRRSLCSRFFQWICSCCCCLRCLAGKPETSDGRKRKTSEKREAPEEAKREVISNLDRAEWPGDIADSGQFRDNKIRTTKYTVLSFIPKNLFEQFHRFANLYFLMIQLLNWIPQINAFAKEVQLIPVIFVLGVTAVKDAFEDRRRYFSDKRVNNDTCRVYSGSGKRYMKTLWKDVRVGDFVHLSCNEKIPADILILSSSDDHGLCYIETCNLDGETNLKQRQVVRGFHAFKPNQFHCKVVCDSPNNQIYRFNGYIETPDGEKLSVCKENLLLRDCLLKNTDFIEGIVVYAGHETKAMLNNGGPRYKRSKLERYMNRDVGWCIAILLLLCSIGAIGHSFWLSSYSDPSRVPFIPSYELTPPVEGFLAFWTFIIILQVMIPLSLYVTIEVIKLGQVYHIHSDDQLYDAKTNKRVECRALNISEELGQIEYIFSDKTGTLTENKMIFRRCTVGGIDYNHHFASISDGCPESPLHGNGDPSDTFVLNPLLENELNSMDMQLNSESEAASGQSRSGRGVQLTRQRQRIQDFFLLLAACNTVVVSKYHHKDNMNASGSYLNLMGTTSSPSAPVSQFPPRPETPQSISGLKRPNSLAVNSNHLSPPRSYTPTPSPGEFRPIYEAESPDEIALVEAAFKYNCKLLGRSSDSVRLLLPGEGLIEFPVLHVLAFDSNRKRMSLILENPFSGEKILYCKGADTGILMNLAPPKDAETKMMIEKTQQQINSYARKGLRVLCMAKRVLAESEYHEWAVEHKAALEDIGGREKKLYASALAIETNLELLGATGIEDRLQEGVSETIASLRAAGIVIWVLTGDKQETAVNIAFSCRLFSHDMELIYLNARSNEQAKQAIEFYFEEVSQERKKVMRNISQIKSPAIPGSPGFINNLLGGNPLTRNASVHRRRRAIVVDGRTLTYLLTRQLSRTFVDLAAQVSAVLVCRATPLQKASVVRLVKDRLSVLTLAIGDGANDVSMIQTADVGIGISGQEGMQAVMASDFAVSKFQHLERLLLVHGHWCYDRLARTVLYFFYKNASFIFIIFWYQMYCGFTGMVMVDQLYLMVFNVFFIAVPPLILGIYDQDCPSSILLKRPNLYSRGRRAEIYTEYSFWVNMLDALYQSIIIFFVPALVHFDTDTSVWEFGTLVITACIFVQLLHLAIETRSWTWLHVSAISFSIVSFFTFAYIYNSLSVGSQTLQNPYMVFQRLVNDPVYWFTLLLITFLACLPRFVLRSLQTTVTPSDVVEALCEEKLECDARDFEEALLNASVSRPVLYTGWWGKTGNRKPTHEKKGEYTQKMTSA